MGVTIATVRVAAETDAAPNTQNITTADCGNLTPKAVLFTVTYATADDTPTAGKVLGIGAATAANEEWRRTCRSADNVGTTLTGEYHNTAGCLAIVDPSADATTDGLAEFVQFINNGVQINWTEAPSAEYLITATFFCGTDLSAYAAAENMGNAIDAVIEIEDVGFEADVVFCVSAGIGVAGHLQTSMGFVHNNGGITQRVAGWFAKDANATAAVSSNMRTDAAVGQIAWTAGNWDWWGEFTAFDADGFDVTCENAGPNNSDLYFLALYFDGAVSSKVGDHSTPVGVGNDAEADPGFKPQADFLIETPL